MKTYEEPSMLMEFMRQLVILVTAVGTVVGGFYIKDRITTSSLEGQVVREYGKVQYGNYGFKLKSNYGRDFYVTLGTKGEFGKEKAVSVSDRKSVV